MDGQPPREAATRRGVWPTKGQNAGTRTEEQIQVFSSSWLVAYHSLFFVDFYLWDGVGDWSTPSAFVGGPEDQGIGPDGAAVLPNLVYTREQLLDYVAYCRARARAIIGHPTAEQTRRRYGPRHPHRGKTFDQLLDGPASHTRPGRSVARGSPARGLPTLCLSSTATARRLFAARPRSQVFLDVGIAAAALAGSLALLSYGGIDHSRPGPGALNLAGVVLAACATVPLIAWRRFPLGVFVVTAAASVLLAGLGYRADPIVGPTAALYLLAASREGETPWTWPTTAAVVGLLLAYLGATAAAQGTFPRIELFHTGLGWAVAWFAGERTRLRREQLAELRERSLRVRQDAERERLLAVAEERARIARDLHDSAGHAINVIAVRAGAARLRHHQDPDRSLLALEAVEEIARQTAEEIDQIVGTLRDGGSANGVVEAPPALASLGTLMARHRAAGLEVTFDTAGTPRPPGGAADQAAYRILQEALTNAARHGAGSVRVELTFGDAAVELSVTNPVLGDGEPQSGRGHGLIGMRERATLLGGSLDAQRANDAFQIRARIPYGGHRA